MEKEENVKDIENTENVENETMDKDVLEEKEESRNEENDTIEWIKKIRNEIIGIAVSVFTASTIFIICDIFFKLVTWNTYSTPTESLKFAIPFSVVIYTLLFAITKKTGTATLISYISIFLMSIINELKIVFTSEPLYFSDINFLSKAGDLMQLVTNNVSSAFVWKFVVICTVYLWVLGMIVYLNYMFGIKVESKKIRIPIIVVDLIILLLLFVPNKTTKEFYLKTFFNTDEYVDFDSYTTNLGFYNRNGFINGMYGTWLNSVFVEPKEYDEEKLNSILASFDGKKKEENKNGKPNIIVIFSEAFWDIDVLEEIEFDKPITSNFNNLKEKGELVNIISPSYGGMSENVSFELLTGGSMNYFSRGYIPIMSLYSRKNSENAPSIIKNLKENGYKTEITFGKDYYDSESAYKKIGFDVYDEMAEYTTMYDKDQYSISYLINKIRKKDDNPLFSIMATMEGHMPFAKNKYKEYDISITKSEFSENVNDTLLSYSQGIYNADQQLGVLYEFIQSTDEPTILLFLGDHLPYLYTPDGENVIDELKYFNTENELENNYRLYNPQALILTNYDCELEIPDYLGTDMLLNCVVNQLDLELEPYYKWLYEVTSDLPGSNRNIAFDKDGKLYNPQEITEEMQEVYDTRRAMQYKLFIDN